MFFRRLLDVFSSLVGRLDGEPGFIGNAESGNAGLPGGKPIRCGEGASPLVARRFFMLDFSCGVNIMILGVVLLGSGCCM